MFGPFKIMTGSIEVPFGDVDLDDVLQALGGQAFVGVVVQAFQEVNEGLILIVLLLLQEPEGVQVLCALFTVLLLNPLNAGLYLIATQWQFELAVILYQFQRYGDRFCRLHQPHSEYGQGLVEATALQMDVGDLEVNLRVVAFQGECFFVNFNGLLCLVQMGLDPGPVQVDIIEVGELFQTLDYVVLDSLQTGVVDS